MEWVGGFSAGLAGGHQLGYGGAEAPQPFPDHPDLPMTFADDLGNLAHFLALVKVEYHLLVLVQPLLFIGFRGRDHGI